MRDAYRSQSGRPRRRINITITDPWSVEEIAVAMDRQISERIWKYGTLYDLTGSAWVPSEPDVLWLVKRAQQQAALHGVRGAIAVVVGRSSADTALLRQYAEYGGAHSHVLCVCSTIPDRRTHGWSSRETETTALASSYPLHRLHRMRISREYGGTTGQFGRRA